MYLVFSPIIYTLNRASHCSDLGFCFYRRHFCTNLYGKNKTPAANKLYQTSGHLQEFH